MAANTTFTKVVDCINKGTPEQLESILASDPSFDINQIGKDKDAVIHKAIKAKKPDLLKILIAHKANVNLKQATPTGNTPLHLALNPEQPEIVWLLLQAKADTKASNAMGVVVQQKMISCGGIIKLLAEGKDWETANQIHSEEQENKKNLEKAREESAARQRQQEQEAKEIRRKALEAQGMTEVTSFYGWTTYHTADARNPANTNASLKQYAESQKPPRCANCDNDDPMVVSFERRFIDRDMGTSISYELHCSKCGRYSQFSKLEF